MIFKVLKRADNEIFRAVRECRNLEDALHSFEIYYNDHVKPGCTGTAYLIVDFESHSSQILFGPLSISKVAKCNPSLKTVPFLVLQEATPSCGIKTRNNEIEIILKYGTMIKTENNVFAMEKMIEALSNKSFSSMIIYGYYTKDNNRSIYNNGQRVVNIAEFTLGESRRKSPSRYNMSTPYMLNEDSLEIYNGERV